MAERPSFLFSFSEVFPPLWMRSFFAYIIMEVGYLVALEETHKIWSRGLEPWGFSICQADDASR